MSNRNEVGRRHRRRARWLALQLTAVYAVAASLWILLSDRALGWLGLSRDLALELASVKGMAFVVVTSTLLFLLALRFLHSLRASQERYSRLFDNAVEGLTLFRVVRDGDGAVTDLELADINPTQEARTGLRREEAIGMRLSRPDGFDERTRSYLEVVANAAGSGLPSRSELHVESDDAYELLEAYPVGPDRWALASLDITEVRHAEQALRRQEETIRRAYVDVLDAVTGGKLILLTEEELGGQLGVPLTEPVELTKPGQLARARRDIVAAAGEGYPGWAPRIDIRTPVCEALVNAINHAGGGSYQVFSANGLLQVAIRDTGPGIDFRTLPKATLVSGFSTASSLGMGFTIMLQSCERVLLSTRPGRTSVVLEFSAARPSTRVVGMEARRSGLRGQAPSPPSSRTAAEEVTSRPRRSRPAG